MEAVPLAREGGAVRSRDLVAKPGRGTARPQGAPSRIAIVTALRAAVST